MRKETKSTGKGLWASDGFMAEINTLWLDNERMLKVMKERGKKKLKEEKKNEKTSGTCWLSRHQCSYGTVFPNGNWSLESEVCSGNLLVSGVRAEWMGVEGSQGWVLGFQCRVFWVDIEPVFETEKSRKEVPATETMCKAALWLLWPFRHSCLCGFLNPLNKSKLYFMIA
jgi:hypothetical protein